MKHKTIKKRRVLNKTRKKEIKEKPWAILQYDDRGIEEMYKKVVEVNKKYCKLHGYTYIYRKDHFDLPPYWIKVKLSLDLLKTNKYKGILWMDTDAGIYDCKMTLEEFTKDTGKHFFISKDAWFDSKYKINAGVWMVKNTAIGRNIMKAWFNKYNRDLWIKKDNKWTVDMRLPKIRRAWAISESFEQGCFNQFIIPAYDDNIKIFPASILSHWIPSEKDGSFIGHFFKHIKTSWPAPHDAEYYIKQYLKHVCE